MSPNLKDSMETTEEEEREERWKVRNFVKEKHRVLGKKGVMMIGLDDCDLC